MSLRIETELVSQFLAPISPAECRNGMYHIDSPSWLMNKGDMSQLAVFELGTGHMWFKKKSGRAVFILGRNEMSDVVVENLLISRCHAAIMQHFSGRIYLVDLGSAHGTYIGNDRLTPFIPTFLHEGALFRFGVYPNKFAVKSDRPANSAGRCYDGASLLPQSGLPDDQQSYENTLTNRTLSFWGLNLSDVPSESSSNTVKVELLKAHLGEGAIIDRQNLHRTETLDAESLQKLHSKALRFDESKARCSSNNFTALNESKDADSGSTTGEDGDSFEDSSSTDSTEDLMGLGNNSDTSSRSYRRKEQSLSSDRTDGLGSDCKRVRFM